MELKSYLNDRRKMIDQALEALFPHPEGPAGDVIEAMRLSFEEPEAIAHLP